jgi:hypothetical protein
VGRILELKDVYGLRQAEGSFDEANQVATRVAVAVEDTVSTYGHAQIVCMLMQMLSNRWILCRTGGLGIDLL